jgi:hypothetical protein
MGELHGLPAAPAASLTTGPTTTEAVLQSLPEVPSHEIRLPEEVEAASEEVQAPAGRVAVAS